MSILIVSMLPVVRCVFLREDLLLDLEKKLFAGSRWAVLPGFVGVSNGGSSVRTFFPPPAFGETSVAESVVVRLSLGL
jgi:hypothetical protein